MDAAQPLSYGRIPETILVRALWEHSQSRGAGCLTERLRSGASPTTVELQPFLRPSPTTGRVHLDYVCGRPLKVVLDVRAKELHRADLYDRDAPGGPGTAARVVALLAAHYP